MTWDLAMDVLRELALVVLIGSNLRRLYVMQRNTRHWNGLGRALRAEVTLYAVVWSWILARPFWDPLRHPLLFLAMVGALIVVTVVVTRRLPPIEDGENAS